MNIDRIAVGRNAPEEINVIVEIPQGGSPVKYEFDKQSGALTVDRFLHTAMFYPAHYGFVPHTLSPDGDPLDVLVITQVPVMPTAVIRSRPVGALILEDESGGDEKIVAVPADDLHPFFAGIRSYRDLPPLLCEQIAHFFRHYKDLEPGKWVKVMRWAEPAEAKALIAQAIARQEAAQ